MNYKKISLTLLIIASFLSLNLIHINYVAEQPEIPQVESGCSYFYSDNTLCIMGIGCFSADKSEHKNLLKQYC